MQKSMCNGCKYWEVAEEFDISKFHYCTKFPYAISARQRRNICNGKYKTI